MLGFYPAFFYAVPYSKKTGISNALSSSLKSDGLFFCRMSVPRFIKSGSPPLYGDSNSRILLNGTKSVVIHSPLAFAKCSATIFPSQSVKITGKSASKNHVPFASPLIVRGLVITDSGRGLVVLIRSGSSAAV